MCWRTSPRPARSTATAPSLKVRTLAMPDRFLDQDKPEAMVATAELDARESSQAVFAALGRTDATPARRA